MACGDVQNFPKYMTYAKSNIPIVGALIDYIATSARYVKRKASVGAEILQPTSSNAILTSTFIAAVCLTLGIVCNIKFEVITLDEKPLPYDLHFMVMSERNNLYIDEIDVSRILWCLEASDALVILIATLLIWISSNVRSPLSEYLFLPWMGAALRGLLLRQAPTAIALLYTMTVVDGRVNLVFFTTFVLLFLLEARLWLEVARLVRARWERRNLGSPLHSMEYFVETLWSNDDVQSVEVGNFVY